MRKIGFLSTAMIAAILLLTCVAFADVYNVSLASVDNSGITGMASTLSGSIAGPNPYYNVEVNVRMSSMPSSNMVYEAWLVDNQTNTKTSLGALDGMTLSSRMKLVNFTNQGPYDAIAVSMEPVRDVNPAPGRIVAQGNLPGTTVSAADFPSMAVLSDQDMFRRQLVTQRYTNLTNQQVMNLRMSGWSYDDIALLSNAAVRCGNRTVTDIAMMRMQGNTWDQIASMCNTTVALLLDPIPAQAVAGFRGEITTPGAIRMPMTYGMLPNGRPIVTQQVWDQYSKAGYSWREVAVAANISSMTGEDIDNILRMTRVQGMTFSQIAMARGLDMDRVMDVSRWPFTRNGEVVIIERMPEMPAATTAPGTMPDETMQELPPPTGNSGY